MTSRARIILDLALQAKANQNVDQEQDNQQPNSFTDPVISSNENLGFENFDIETLPIVLGNDVAIEIIPYEEHDKGAPIVIAEDNVEASTSSLSLRDTEKYCGNPLNGGEHEDDEHEDDYNNDDEHYLPTHEIGLDGDDSVTETDSEESHNDATEGVQAHDTSVEWGDINEGRKRKKVANKSEWKRVKNQKLRMKGQEYLGFSRDKSKTFKQSTIRSARRLGARCSSKMCLKSKQRFCSFISEETRNEIFVNFWEKLTWDQRKIFVSAHVTMCPPS